MISDYKRKIVTKLTQEYGHEDGSLYWHPDPCISLIIDAVKSNRMYDHNGTATPFRRWYKVKLEITLIPKI